MFDPYDPIVSAASGPKPSSYNDIIERHATANGLDGNLVRAVMGQESSGNRVAVSPKGARGLMQLMPATAKRFGVTNPNDPEQSIAGGTKYLKYLSDRYNGDTDKILAGYNAGEGNVDKYGGIPPFKETQNYVPSVKARYAKLSGQQKPIANPYDSIVRAATAPDPQTPAIKAAEADVESKRQVQANLGAQIQANPYDSIVAAATPQAAGRGAGMARAQGTTYPMRRRTQPQQGWGGGGTIGQGVPTVSVNAMGGSQANGVGGLRQIDDPETSRIIRAQQQVTGEQTPLEKHLGLGPGSEESKTLALRRTENEAVLERVAAERAQEDQSAKQSAWEQANQSEIDRHVADYRKQIQDSGMTKWLTELQGKGAAELMQFGAGAAKTVGATNAANAMRIRAVAAAQAAQEESKDRTEASKTVQDILGGFAGSAPELLLMQVGIPPVVTFAAGSGLKASGMGRPVVPAITQGALTGAAFEIPEAGAPGVRGTLTRAGKVGAATAGVDLATGQPVSQALKSGAVNAGMVAVPGLINERLARRGTNEAQINRTADQEVAPAGSGAPRNAAGTQEPDANQPNVPRAGSEQGGVGPAIRVAPEAIASATDISEPVRHVIVRGKNEDSVTQSRRASVIQPTIENASPDMAVADVRVKFQPSANDLGNTPNVSQPEPIRHVDLQPRTPEGQFDEETPAQAEARRQQVTQSVSTPQPDLSTQAQPSLPERSYEDVQRAIDRRETELENQGINPIRLYDSSEHKATDLPPDWKPMPADLAALYRERDAIDKSKVEATTKQIDRQFEPLIPDADARNKFVRKIAQADLPTALRAEYNSERWRATGEAVDQMMRYISQNVTNDHPYTAFVVKSEIGGAPDNIQQRLRITQEPGLGPSQATLDETQRWVDHLYGPGEIKIPGAKITKTLPFAHTAINITPQAAGVASMPEGKPSRMQTGGTRMPLMVFRGTRGNEILDFGTEGEQRGLGASRLGVWFTNKEGVARQFSNMSTRLGEPKVNQHSINLRNPKILDGEEFLGLKSLSPQAQVNLRNKLIAEGYDGVIHRERSGVEYYAVFRPEQIKPVSPKVETALGGAKDTQAEPPLEQKPESTQVKPSEPVSLPIKPELSTTSARKAQVNAEREVRNVEALPRPVRKSDKELMASAKAANEAEPSKPLRLAQEGRALSDKETVQIDLRAQQVKNEYSQVMKEIGDATDPNVIKSKTAEADVLEKELDTLEKAWRGSGTENARALRAHQITINQDFDLLSVIQRMKKAKGRDLTGAERTKYADMVKERDQALLDRDAALERAHTAELQRQINRAGRQRKRSETKESLDTEAGLLKQNVVAEIARLKSQSAKGQFTSMSGLGSLDPDGVIAKNLVKYARNRVKANVGLKAEALIDEVHDLVKDFASRRQVAEVLSGYMKPRDTREMDAATKQLAAIRKEISEGLAKQDIVAGTRTETAQGPSKRFVSRNATRLKQLQAKEADLTARMAAGDYSARAKPEPLPYTREVYAAEKRAKLIERQFQDEAYKANRGIRGRILDTAASFGNIPKTLKSMADISAVFRQGGFYALTHPVEGLVKPGRDMFRAFSETGYRNVENAIKNHPKFDLAKRSGVEFTGVDKDDPNLSHHEEGYLGVDALTAISKGKLNPLRIVKGTADFSERTFVSFLDSQRMHVFNQMAEGLDSQGITYRTNPEAYKAAAKLVNQGTGRGNLGRAGNQAAPLLNLAMFSPRLVASRVQLLNNMFNPVKMASMPRGTRSMMIKDNVKFLAATAAILGLARAAGGTVNTDPDDGDFLKIRLGSTTYDTLTGIQQPLRYIINMTRAAPGSETYPGKSMKQMTDPLEPGSFTRSKLSPLAGFGVDALTGSDFTGRKFSLKREAADLVTPLPAKDFIEAMQKEGLIKGFVKALPTITGVGVNTYDQNPDKPTTTAGKLAHKLVVAQMPIKERTDEEVDKSKKLSDLKARSRKGEDVSKALEDIKATDRQMSAILDASGKTKLEEDFNHLGPKDALVVYGTASPKEREMIRPMLENKTATSKIDKLDSSVQTDIRARMKKLGLQERTPGQIVPSLPQQSRPVRKTPQLIGPTPQ